MAMKVNVTSNIKDVRRSLTTLQKEVLPQATNRSLNRVGGSINTQVRRYVAREAGITQKDLKRRGFFANLRSNIRTMTYTVIVRYGAIPLKDFNPRQTKKGVTAKAWGQRKVYDGAFIVDKLGRHVFVRKTKNSLPIKKLYGAIPSRVADSPVLEDNVQGIVDQRLGREMMSNINYFVAQRMKRRARGR